MRSLRPAIRALNLGVFEPAFGNDLQVGSFQTWMPYLLFEASLERFEDVVEPKDLLLDFRLLRLWLLQWW